MQNVEKMNRDADYELWGTTGFVWRRNHTTGCNVVTPQSTMSVYAVTPVASHAR
jgi:hypothetical protein